jgi:VanZ family protein
MGPPGRAFLVAIFIGISVSLSIEMLQSYFPTRDSSMTDLICNTIGTILGMMLL